MAKASSVQGKLRLVEKKMKIIFDVDCNFTFLRTEAITKVLLYIIGTRIYYY